MSLLASRRRRRILFGAVFLVAGGYFTYRVHNSPAFRRKRKQLIQIISSLSFFCESVSQCAESLSIVSKDLKSFILSDEDSVPRSLRQALKIGQCPEFQGTVTVLSAALTRGLLRGIRGHAVNQGRRQTGQVNRGSQNCPAEDAACREIREVGLPALRGELQRRMKTFEDDASVVCEEKREVILSGEVLPTLDDRFERKMDSNMCGGDMPVVTSEKTNVILESIRRGQEDDPTPQDISETLLRKLFSEPGLGFASAVVGSFARNCVTALIDGFRNQPLSIGPFTKGFVDSLDGNPAPDSRCGDSRLMIEIRHKIVDVLCTDGCRTLIAECVQNFVSTAVSVYIDKTKDVNFYDDMVAGITNPSHRAPMKDVLTSVCNGAVETLVRTTHDVLLVRKSEQSELDAANQQTWRVDSLVEDSTKPVIESTYPGKDLQMHNQPTRLSTVTCYQSANANGKTLQSFEIESCSSKSFGEACEMDGEHNQLNETLRKNGRRSSNWQSFVTGLSKTLAIPSNHKLVVDVAGTMTSEAIRSFSGVVMSTVSSYFRTKSEILHNRADIDVSGRTDNQNFQLQTKSRKGMDDLAMKAFLLATICLAICLHVLAGVHGLENA